jgi:hypothetical protein
MFEDDDLELAFQLHVFDEVIAADAVQTEREKEFLDLCFPSEVLRTAGFVDEAGARTPRFQAATAEALATLPGRLSLAAKLDLLEAIFRLAVVDRTFRIGEGTVLLQAARALGLSDEDFDRFLSRRPAAMGMSAELLDPQGTPFSSSRKP